ncbi:MAG: Asp-tRNA(Asn)/Glu-tRNA(Gln) amidotransferase GatCAB subunit B, partial [Mycoplasmataceae bacterium]|nr:Asp-tRNA(Asn)/Glu-tRNA(Gln) amidotransferase GatCAB subunit B [Mycoplasmataceae bacterium]
HNENETMINYNRAGIPLIEIVTMPDIKSAEEAVKYVDFIRQNALFLGISDAIMAQGSLRADINLSMRMLGSNNFGTKVEIKNLNSLNNIAKAIEFESNLQIKKILNN